MIYLRCKYDIISVPSYAEGIYHRTAVRYHSGDISPVPSGTDIIVKNLFCPVDKRGFLHGAGYGSRTRLHGLGSRCITDIRTLQCRYYSKPHCRKQALFLQTETTNSSLSVRHRRERCPQRSENICDLDGRKYFHSTAIQNKITPSRGDFVAERRGRRSLQNGATNRNL